MGLLLNDRTCSNREHFYISFRADPFSEGEKSILTELPPLKVYHFPLSGMDTRCKETTLLEFLSIPFEKGVTLRPVVLSLDLWDIS